MAQIMAELVAQVTHYFSDDNLKNDTYMWEQMDQEHYLPIAEIARWRRVQLITSTIGNNIEIVTQALRACPNAEVEGSRVRPRQSRFISPHLPQPQPMFQFLPPPPPTMVLPPPPPTMVLPPPPPMFPVFYSGGGFQPFYAAPQHQMAQGAQGAQRVQGVQGAQGAQGAERYERADRRADSEDRATFTFCFGNCPVNLQPRCNNCHRG